MCVTEGGCVLVTEECVLLTEECMLLRDDVC